VLTSSIPAILQPLLVNCFYVMTIEEAIRATLKEYEYPPYEMGPAIINEGECYGFARKVQSKLPAGYAQLTGDPRCVPPEVGCKEVSQCGHVWLTGGRIAL